MIRVEGHRLPKAKLGDTNIVELPYVGDTIGMVVLVPPTCAFEASELDLDVDTLFTAFQRLSSKQGTLRFPKFAFESAMSLPDAPKTLGMQAPFDPNRADFREMYHVEWVNRDLFIGDVRHRTAVEIDEQGTTAAADTGVEGQVRSAPTDPFEVTVDRPFLLCIRHRPTNPILFLGRVGDAGAAQGDS